MNHKKITVVQRMKNGFLSNKRPVLNLTYKNFDISLEDAVYRKIVIKTLQETDRKNLLNTFLLINRLCMIFDGCFYDIDSVVFDDDDLVNIDDFCVLDYYKMHSDFYGGNLQLVNSGEALTTELLKNLTLIDEELLYPNNAFMYMTHIGGLPLDMRTAFLVECYEPLAHYVSFKRNEVVPQVSSNRSEPTLYDCLSYIINLYGGSIFNSEVMDGKLEYRINQMKNNRHQLMHLRKDMKNKPLLNKNERITYSRKLHILYRHTLLHLMGFDVNIYTHRLTQCTTHWEKYLVSDQEDTHNG